jgi:1,4-alpha-glucan branching enzyme
MKAALSPRRSAFDDLADARHHDPFSFLGPHVTDGGVAIRVMLPNAAQATLIRPGADPAAMERRHPAGGFEVLLEGVHEIPDYRLRVVYPGDYAVEIDDPYRYGRIIGDFDLYLFGEGSHKHVYDTLGAHPMRIGDSEGVHFAVWAPNAHRVSVVGDFNGWDGRLNPMRSLGASGIWELFVPGLGEGERYKYELKGPQGELLPLKADPYALAAEVPPATASRVYRSRHEWRDDDWLDRRRAHDPLREPVSIYEVHLESWRRNPLEANRALSYLELADELAEYATDLGFTHVELLPVMHHPFPGSWGYQVTGYFAPTPRLGEPDDLKTFVERLHGHGVGVILDWVPAHFPRDEWALARFDGTALYEHDDPRRGAHPDWGTLVFNLGRNEVCNFLLANALFWLEEYHADGLRVDAVASMLYLDYSREDGEWVPNRFGGNEDLDAVDFLRRFNELVHDREPGTISAAEESTAWPGVSRPTYLGGLGFGFKWNMGWMHDTLDYFQREPVHRRFHHHQLTFSLMYAFSENFVLPLSHDEVVHGKGSLLQKMPGDRWQQLANLRALYAYMWAHPGKKLLFMGGELAQEREWDHAASLDWHLLEQAGHSGVQSLVRDLNRLYRTEPALHEVDFDPAGFRWLEPNDADANVLAFARLPEGQGRPLVCVCNLSPVPREAYRLGLPRGGSWRELLNTDSTFYGGSDVGNLGAIAASGPPWHEQPQSAELHLPPLAVVWLVPED